MKIQKEHYNVIKEKIALIDRDAIKSHALQVKESGKYKDFDTRMRWDIFWASKLNDWVRDNVYTYANDEHINTALKNIVKELNIQYN